MKLSDQNAIIAEQSKQIENLKQDISYLWEGSIIIYKLEEEIMSIQSIKDQFGWQFDTERENIFLAWDWCMQLFWRKKKLWRGRDMPYEDK
jgi:hypothetical protein